MGETLNILFCARDDGTYEVRLKESWSGKTVHGRFIPPYTNRQVNALQKKLNALDTRDHELRDIGQRLFHALCGADTSKHIASIPIEAGPVPDVQAVLRGAIQRTLKRRGTVALTLSFDVGCDAFVRYPWELLHNGDHFLLVSGVFTLSRVLLRPDSPVGCELPVHPPMRILYISASPSDCVPLETERSFEAMEQAFTPLIDAGQVFLDRLEPPTFGQLVRYLNSYGGTGMLDDSDTTIPCYVIHFDGHGAYGRLCPKDGCDAMNEPEARKCRRCGTSLSYVTLQTYLCFCNEDGTKHFVETQSLRDLLLSSDVRLAVFSACETATVSSESNHHHTTTRAAVDATLATALVTAQVPAVVAMPFSLQDDLSPTFMYHFYEALVDGRTLEEALSRARQAMLPMQQKSWFIPVLYRHVAEGEEMPVPLIAPSDGTDEHTHPLAHLGPASTFVGREKELHELDDLLTSAANGPQVHAKMNGPVHTGRAHFHHIALTGSAGMGKSALAFEVAQRNRDKFQGGVVGVSLRSGKTFHDALLEIIQQLHLPVRNAVKLDSIARERLVQSTLRSLASRELSCLLVMDGLEEISDHEELTVWLRFLCSVPQEIVVLVTSRSNPENMMVMGGPHCRWYEYHLEKMTNADLLNLFSVLAYESGLDQRIHLENPNQQAILRDICTLLDGYPLGAELIFGTAHSIGGKLYTPVAATRSLEEVRDELRETPLAGMLAVLEISYRRLSSSARLLLAYLATFNLPFSHDQILLLISADAVQSDGHVVHLRAFPDGMQEREVEEISFTALAKNWRSARDELVQASFMQFDGRVYSIHSQIRHFALSLLPIEERRRIHRIIAAYYAPPDPSTKNEWVAAFEHLELAGEQQDLQEAVQLALRVARVSVKRGYTHDLQEILRRAAVHAARLTDRTLEGHIQRTMGIIFRALGKTVEAEVCLRSSYSLFRQLSVPEDAAWSLVELAQLFCDESDFQQADRSAQEAWELFQQTANSEGQAWTQVIKGWVNLGRNYYTPAFEHFEQALAAFNQSNNKEGQAACYYGHASVHAARGRYATALHDYEEAKSLFEALGSLIDRAWVLVGMGATLAHLDKLEVVEKVCKDALTVFHDQEMSRGKAKALQVMGRIMCLQNNYISAREYYQEAYTLFKASGSPEDRAALFNSFGELHTQMGDYLSAKDSFEQASSLARMHSAKRCNGRALRGFGDVALHLQQYDEAERYYHDAMVIMVDIGALSEQCEILQRLVTLHLQRDAYRKALESLAQAHELAQDLLLPISADIEQRLNTLVAEQHLEEVYTALNVRRDTL
jgi:tetratricopeptide (TPR) repeat protein